MRLSLREKFTPSFFIFTVLFLISAHVSGQSTVGEVSPNERKAVESLLKSLSSTDMRVVSEAQQNAKQYPYVEVFDKVIDNIQTQALRAASGQNTNPHILSTGLIAVLDLAGPGQREVLANFIADFSDYEPAVIEALRSGQQYVTEAFRNLKENYELGEVNLKSLPVESISDLVRSKVDQSTAELIISGTVNIPRDTMIRQKQEGTYVPVIGREEETIASLEVLARLTGANVNLSGPAGSGKSSVAKNIDAYSAHGKIPKRVAFAHLQDLIVFETSPARISSLAKSNDNSAQSAVMEGYLDAIIEAQESLGKKIVIFIDEAHTLSSPQIEAMKRYTGDTSDISFIFASTSEEFILAMKNNPAFLRRVKDVPVEEYSPEKVKEILLDSWIPRIQDSTGTQFEDEVITKAIEHSEKLFPYGGRIDGSIKALNDLAIQNSPEGVNSPQTEMVTEEDFSRYLMSSLSLPVDPDDLVATQKFFSELIDDLNTTVHGQPRMVEDLTELYQSLIQDKTKNVSTAMVVGPTGVGKSFLARLIAEKVLSNSKAVFEIDGNEHTNGGYSLNSLFGAPPGVISSNKSSGQFIEWLDDKAKGGKGGILIINELDKAHQDLIMRIMELMDTGQVKGADGKARNAKNLMIVTTTNKSVDMIFPKGWEAWSEDQKQKFAGRLTEAEIKKAIDYSTKQGESKIPPEVKNRVDRYSIGMPLSRKSAEKIVGVSMDKQNKALSQQYDILFEYDDSFLVELTNHHFEPEYGARPLERAVKMVFIRLKNEMIKNDNGPTGKVYRVSYDPAENKYQLSNADGETIAQIDSGVAYEGDPLENDELMHRLIGFQESVENVIYGQNEMISKISNAILGFFGSLFNDRGALNFFLVGSSGTGKSEFAKVIAEVLYGHRDRVGFINLGEVRHNYDFSNIFSPPRGVEGHKEVGQFEQYLIENPEGGVLLFDEASNMGGNDKARKNELFKKIYEITDERYWTSKVTGKTYDLSQHIFIHTGNEGEQLFAGQASEDMRMAVWDEYKDEDKVRQLVIQSGVPEAFVGRMSEVILMAPLSSMASSRIAEKFMAPQLKALKDKGYQISFAEDFEAELARLFFTQQRGGRSLRDVIRNQLNSLLVSARLKAIQHNLSSPEFFLEVSDSYENQAYIDAEIERVVELRVSLRHDGEEKERLSLNLTSKAEKLNIQSFESALNTAVHESGHAVTNEPEHSNKTLEFLTIKGSGRNLGYARYKRLPGFPSMTEEKYMRNIAISLAGSVAQQLAGFPADSGRAQDLKQAREMAKQMVVDLGLTGEFIGQATQGVSRDNQRAIDEVVRRAWHLAVDVVAERWFTLVDLTKALMLEGELSREQLDSIFIDGYKKKVKDKKLKEALNALETVLDETRIEEVKNHLIVNGVIPVVESETRSETKSEEMASKEESSDDKDRLSSCERALRDGS